MIHGPSNVNLPHSSADCFEMWNLNLLKPSGPVQAYIWIALTLPSMLQDASPCGILENVLKFSSSILIIEAAGFYKSWLHF